MASSPILRELILRAAKNLNSVSDTPKLDAEVLLQSVSGFDRTQLIIKANDQLPDQIIEQFQAACDRRKQGEPIAYIVGFKEFYGRQFKVNSSVLCPRPETEQLVDLALAAAESKDQVSFLDLGTGSGCLAVSLALELAKREIAYSGLAVDKFPVALLTAYANSKQHHVHDQVSFERSDWFSAVKPQKFDLILSNPPYVQSTEAANLNLKFEPDTALYSGEDGLDDIKKILTDLESYVHPGSTFLLEFGSTQAEPILKLCKTTISLKHTAMIHQDLAGLDRVLSIQF